MITGDLAERSCGTWGLGAEGVALIAFWESVALAAHFDLACRSCCAFDLGDTRRTRQAPHWRHALPGKLVDQAQAVLAH
jgi:hypothetical protein